MTNSPDSLVRLTKTDVKPAAEMLARAFHEYALLPYFFPDEAVREKVSFYFLAMALYSGVRYGEVYATSPNMEDVAIWYHSSQYPLSTWKAIRCIPWKVIMNFARYSGSVMQPTGRYIEAVHKRLVTFSHWYLEIIGVDPEERGKGYAGKLIRLMLTRIDREGLPCYIETLDEKNVAIYERYGFEMIEESSIPDTSLTCWAMLRRKV